MGPKNTLSALMANHAQNRINFWPHICFTTFDGNRQRLNIFVLSILKNYFKNFLKIVIFWFEKLFPNLTNCVKSENIFLNVEDFFCIKFYEKLKKKHFHF